MGLDDPDVMQPPFCDGAVYAIQLDLHKMAKGVSKFNVAVSG